MKTKPKRWILTFLWTFPPDVIAWLAVLLVRLLFGKRLFWRDGLWVEIREGSFPDATWGRSWSGVTFAHGGILAPRAKALPHELVHVEQYEVRMLCGFIFGIIFALASMTLAGLVVSAFAWISAWPLGYAASLVQAYLRGEDPYKGSELEESAYSQMEK